MGESTMNSNKLDMELYGKLLSEIKTHQAGANQNRPFRQYRDDSHVLGCRQDDL